MITDQFAALRVAVYRIGPMSSTVSAWGEHLAAVLCAGGRLLVCGNGGSAAEARHLAADLVSRIHGERTPMSAIALPGDGSAPSGAADGYGDEEMFARGVRTHGRKGDVLIALSTGSPSRDVMAAVKAAREIGLTTWALTGPAPNPLAEMCDGAIAVDVPTAATLQEVHHMLAGGLCFALDEVLLFAGRS